MEAIYSVGWLPSHSKLWGFLQIKARLIAHKIGESNYTKDRLPVVLRYFEIYFDQGTAEAREKELMGWSDKKKQWLCAAFREIVNGFSGDINQFIKKAQ